MKSLAGAVWALVLCAAPASHGEIAFETGRYRAVLGNDACWQSLTLTGSDRELLDPSVGVAAASVTVDGQQHAASRVAVDRDRLVWQFDAVDTELVYAVERSPDWTVFRLAEIHGSRPSAIVLLQLPTAVGGHLGRRLNIAWDERVSVCLLAADRRTDCRAASRPAGLLVAQSQEAPGPTLEGSAVALLACGTPHVRDLLKQASQAFGLLTNETPDEIPSKQTDLARGSYWFITLGEHDGPEMVDYCLKSGVKQVMLNSGSWCSSPGHYLFNQQRFPAGEAGLKSLVDQFHAAGILVGMHTFVSKVSKRDPYVTPVPDQRFWVDRSDTLAETVSATDTAIRVNGSLREWPGSPVAKQKTWEGGVAKHREVLLDDEIIQYESIGPDGRWDTFQGCRRGAWGTAAAAHATDTAARHYGIDGCIDGYIIDQESGLLDEVADRIAGIFNRCGFDMVYFDGGEDVDRRRFNYYVSRFQEAAVSRFKPRPLVHMGTVMTHLLWHSFTRSSTVDTYLNTLHGAIISGAKVENWPTVRGHIDRSVRYLESVRDDLMPGELGWFGIWPRDAETDGLQLDEFEYLLCKSLAYDAPISLQTSFRQMEGHPLTPQLLDYCQVYEELRMAGAVAAVTRAQLAERGQDFALLLGGAQPRWVQVVPLEPIGPDRALRACVGALDGGAYAELWHTLRGGRVTIPIGDTEVRLSDFRGHPQAVELADGKLELDLGPARLNLVAPGLTPEALRKALEQAEVQIRPQVQLRIEAEDCQRLVGSLVKGSQVGVVEPEASGDVLVVTGAVSPQQPQPWYAEYTVDIPSDGTWTLWARVRYPSGSDESFAVLEPGDELAQVGSHALGNCGRNEGKWHWTGRGGGSTTPPPGQPVTFRLRRGPFTFRVYPRESGNSTRRAPRLDMLCFTNSEQPPAGDDTLTR